MIAAILIAWMILAFVTALILGRIIRSADERQQQLCKGNPHRARFSGHVNHLGRVNK